MNVITSKKISIKYLFRNYNILLYIFIAVLISNFQPWYLMWLIPTFMWQGSTNIKIILGILTTSQLANGVFLLYGENYKCSDKFVLAMSIGILISILISYRRKSFGKVSFSRWK